MEFIIPGQAVPKQSTRFGKGRAYPNPRVTAWEKKVQFFAKAARVHPTKEKVSVELFFYLGDSRRRDLDNLQKGVLDALNGLAWEDDSQVVQMKAAKAIDKEVPRVVVMIEEGI